jgi:hypothetical protein
VLVLAKCGKASKPNKAGLLPWDGEKLLKNGFSCPETGDIDPAKLLRCLLQYD